MVGSRVKGCRRRNGRWVCFSRFFFFVGVLRVGFVFGFEDFFVFILRVVEIGFFKERVLGGVLRRELIGIEGLRKCWRERRKGMDKGIMVESFSFFLLLKRFGGGFLGVSGERSIVWERKEFKGRLFSYRFRVGVVLRFWYFF